MILNKEFIKAFRDLNLSISDIFRRVNRSRKVMSRYLNDPGSYGTNIFQ